MGYPSECSGCKQVEASDLAPDLQQDASLQLLLQQAPTSVGNQVCMRWLDPGTP